MLDEDWIRLLENHINHSISVCSYSDENLSLECDTCGVVLVDVELPEGYPDE